mmetsp:Transcript_91828/g.163433  ORF Transcript_91828/g.163433 Transcript_91828/m.163433 type:complete len:180 (-) Transcript_91828:106-645(-)
MFGVRQTPETVSSLQSLRGPSGRYAGSTQRLGPKLGPVFWDHFSTLTSNITCSALTCKSSKHYLGGARTACECLEEATWWHVCECAALLLPSSMSAPLKASPHQPSPPQPSATWQDSLGGVHELLGRNPPSLESLKSLKPATLSTPSGLAAILAESAVEASAEPVRGWPRIFERKAARP